MFSSGGAGRCKRVHRSAKYTSEQINRKLENVNMYIANVNDLEQESINTCQ